jgi:HEAT repeat protein
VTGGGGLIDGLVAVAAAMWLAVILIAARRAIRISRRPARTARETEARRRLFALLAEPDAADAAEGSLRPLEPIAAGLLPKLRGADRDALIALLERSGALDRARRNLHRRGAIRRAAAADLLGAAGDLRSLPDLVRLLDDRHQDVRVVTARAIGKLGAPAVDPLLGTLDARRPIPTGVVTMALVHAGADGIHELTRALAPSRSTHVRTVAADMLGQLAAYSAADRLIAALARDPSPEVRAAAARSLGRLGVAAARQALADQLRTTEDPGLRLACARALGQVGGAEALALLPDMLGAADYRLARAAADGLSNCGPAGLRVLETAADEPDPSPAARERLAQLALGGVVAPQPAREAA